MGDGLKTMEGMSQNIRPSRQSSNSPIQQGNPSKSLARAKGGQLKSQKFGKWNSPTNGQRNAYPNQNKQKAYQNPQRKGYINDRKPQPRGFKQTERFQQLSVEDHEFELNDDFPVTSRKNQTSLNHLLNFTFAPREQTQHVSTSRKKTVVKGNPYNKEQFLQANCQFVVQDGGDYAVNIVDPDVIVDWDLIEQVRVWCREMPSCPICLYPPTAAQVTRCGHIYCWSCILHYLSLSEKTWRKCPICYESIHKKDLKSVVAVSEHKHSQGQEITMVLMKRMKGSVFALPKFKWIERESVPSLSSDELEMQFSKLLIASPQEILSEVMSKDRSELKSLLLEVEKDKSAEEPYVKLAVDEFEKREERLMKMCNKQSSDNVPNQDSKVELDVQNLALEKCLREECLSAPDPVLCSGGKKVREIPTDKEFSIHEADSNIEQESGKDECTRSSVSSDDSISSLNPHGNSQFYYFYQAQDGQHIFLHPVNARCLIKEYGGLENCPEFISGNIVEMECYSQTEDLRHRFRYLRHLPLTCEFAICELDLQPPVISRDTLNFFKDDLQKRRKRRQKKAKEEARHESKCSSVLSTFTGLKQPRTNNLETPDLSSEQDFPHQAGSNPGIWVASSPPASSPWSSAVSDEERSVPGPSFAKALSTGKRSNPQLSREVRRQSEDSRSDGEKCSEDCVEDDYEAVPSFQSAFTDALMVADWNLNVEGVRQDDKTVGGKGKKKAKRKSNERRLLFSTGSAMKL